MRSLTFSRTLTLPLPVERLFAWHEAPGAFERLNPPWQPVRLLNTHLGIQPGNEVELRIPVGPFGMRATFRHGEYRKNELFTDSQIRGPFRSWEHRHQFAQTPEGSELTDVVTYTLPLSALSHPLAGWKASAELERLFRYRHTVTGSDLSDHAIWSNQSRRILISGASGLIGSALSAYLRAGGHTVHHLVRRPPQSSNERSWNPDRGECPPESVSGYDAVVHLAGENIAARRWSHTQKTKIRESRVRATNLLATALSNAQHRPKSLVAASAIGVYGSRGDETLDEGAPVGSGFLAEVGAAWEGALAPASEVGIRTVPLRFGVVLDPRGGALAKMLWPFLLGVGGTIGSGTQWMSWIALDDALRAILFAITTEAIAGPINVVAPQPVTNREFTTVLGTVLRRPTFATVPAFAARAAFGEMADEALLASTRVLPQKLRDHSFTYRYPELESALRHCLGR